MAKPIKPTRGTVADPDWIDPSDIGPEVWPDDQPAWLSQFAAFLRVHRLQGPGRASGDLLLRCRSCDLALGVPADFDPGANWQTLLELARHGLQHAADGDLTPKGGD